MESATNSFLQSHLVDHIVITQVIDVSVVRSIGSGSEAEKEARPEVVEQSDIRVGCSVVKLINDHIVEVIVCKPRQVALSRQRLNCGEADVTVVVTAVAAVVADGSFRPYITKCFLSLPKYLFPVCYKKDSSVFL